MPRPRFAVILDHFRRQEDAGKELLVRIRAVITRIERRLQEEDEARQRSAQDLVPDEHEQYGRFCSVLALRRQALLQGLAREREREREALAELRLVHRRIRSLEELHGRDRREAAVRSSRQLANRVDELAARQWWEVGA